MPNHYGILGMGLENIDPTALAQPIPRGGGGIIGALRSQAGLDPQQQAQEEMLQNRMGLMQGLGPRNGGGLMGALRGAHQFVRGVGPEKWLAMANILQSPQAGSQALLGMERAKSLKQQAAEREEERKMRREEFELEKARRDENRQASKLMYDSILKKINADGVVTPEEEQIKTMAYSSMLSGDNATLRSFLAPQEEYKPQSTLGKQEEDYRRGYISDAAYNKANALPPNPLDAPLMAEAAKLLNDAGEAALPSMSMRQAEQAGYRYRPQSKDKPPSDAQNLTAGYLNRMVQAERRMTATNESAGGYPAASGTQRVLAAIPGLGRYFTSSEYKRVRQAQEDWVRAKLRKESGAVISTEEMNSEIATYFELPGEDQATIEQKRAARMDAVRQMAFAGGPQTQALLAPGTLEELMPPPQINSEEQMNQMVDEVLRNVGVIGGDQGSQNPQPYQGPIRSILGVFGGN